MTDTVAVIEGPKELFVKAGDQLRLHCTVQLGARQAEHRTDIPCLTSEHYRDRYIKYGIDSPTKRMTVSILSVTTVTTKISKVLISPILENKVLFEQLFKDNFK